MLNRKSGMILDQNRLIAESMKNLNLLNNQIEIPKTTAFKMSTFDSRGAMESKAMKSLSSFKALEAYCEEEEHTKGMNQTF